MELDPWLVGSFVGCLTLEIFMLHRRQKELEQAVNTMARHLGLLAEAGSEPSAKVRRLAEARSGTIEAMRTYREKTASDVRQAKAAIAGARQPRSDA